MATRRSTTLHDLRHAIDCLPTHTKRAMLDGIRSEEIIVGAYSRDGGICPMLAAHRRGGRTSLISFAKAWDAFAFRSSRKSDARRATPRELLVLSSHLEASLLEEEGPSPELAAAIAEHKKLVADRPARRSRPGDPDRTKELQGRSGWSWLRIFRRYDEYQHALALLDSMPHTTAVETELEQVR
jgi:hypothetical protein